MNFNKKVDLFELHAVKSSIHLIDLVESALENNINKFKVSINKLLFDHSKKDLYDFIQEFQITKPY